MKRFVYFVSIVTLASIILSSCAGFQPAPTEALPAVTEPPAVVTEAPVATEAPTLAVEPAATLRTIDIAGPVMEVGAKYPYVDGTTLVGVPSGSFTMGYNSADNPVHIVTLSEFWIYSTEVTNSQYALCVNTGKCSPPDPINSAPNYNNFRYINYPITGVNYDQAVEYCTFVHGRLPTEAEWEKTARGPDANLFPWGNGGPTCELLNYKFCEGKTTKVTQYKKGVSYYGAFDMSGDVREWVADWYSPTYYTESAAVADPLGPLLGEKRSVRSSSFQDSADPSISAHRFSLKPTENLPDLGFRCVVEDPTYFAPLCTQLAYIGTGPNGEEANCTPAVKCNDVKVVEDYTCSGDPAWQKTTNITFTLEDAVPPIWSHSHAGDPGFACTQKGGFPEFNGDGVEVKDRYECVFPGPYTANVQGHCSDTASCVSVCPVNYNKVGDVCQWNGSGTIGTECIAGTTYDPVNQCCVATPGTGVDFTLCPAGFYPVDGACFANPPKVEDSMSLNVGFIISCEPQHSGDDGPCDPADPTCVTPVGCTVSQSSCGAGGTFDPGKCCCRYGVATNGGPFACTP